LDGKQPEAGVVIGKAGVLYGGALMSLASGQNSENYIFR
jgi:hypothetical protein